MTDGELLEFAAKASGAKKSSLDNGEPFYIGVATDHAWNPLIYDGDAMRLSAHLRLDLTFYNGFQEVHAEPANSDGLSASIEKYGDDVLAAARRAIVRAAANIGRLMP